MADLDKFPMLRGLMRNSPDIRWAYNVVVDLYQGRRRVSGRLVIDHCFETAENATRYTISPVYLITAVFHDIIEDFGLNLKDLKSIFEGPQYIKWQSFRESEDSRNVGLTLPHFLLRLPYGPDTKATKRFNYK